MLDIDPALIDAPYYEEAPQTFDESFIYFDDMTVALKDDYESQRTTNTPCVEKVTLVLYSRSQCPYCKKVIKFLKSVNKKIPIKDIGKDSSAAKELLKVGGKKQVPCLFINEEPLYESSDIIQWLKDNTDKY